MQRSPLTEEEEEEGGVDGAPRRAVLTGTLQVLWKVIV